MADKAPGKGEGEYAEAGDEAFQQERLSSIEAFLTQEFGYQPPVQTVGADAPAPEEAEEAEEG